MSKNTPLTQSIDALLSPVFQAAEPGAAVIVTQNGRTVFRKGYGLANVELRASIRPAMALRIGSVTKQFTAVAVLMLVQEGKLALDADLTTYLPDYPTQGEKITIEHLLTHTSGIKSYTSMSEWMPLWRKDLPLQELIDLFKVQPLDFKPGERWAYNNSAFVLLGAVIEKVSGQSYAQFLAERIFQPLGMKATQYDLTEKIIPGRVAGYNKGANGWENAPYLSMTHPHGAGALISSVDDLARWDAALYSGKLVQPELLQKAWTPYILADGRATQYGYGWGISPLAGKSFIEHGGGINGFICHALRMPEERIFVAILTNRTGTEDHLGMLALQIAFLTAAIPFPEIQPFEAKPEALAACQGVYQVSEKEELTLTVSEGKVFAQRTGGGKDELTPVSASEFCYKDSPFTRIAILHGPGSKISGLEVRGRFGPYEPARLTDKPLPEERQGISLPVEVLLRYVGQYELAPGMLLDVRLKGESLMVQPGGQPEADLFAETETRFFVKIVDASLEFELDAAGLAVAVNFTQGQFQTRAKRK
jgi:CubicO group peptidase (beta-lactamase class C family)